jgi:hypothetical protein
VFGELKKDLVKYLSGPLKGDEVAATYLLCHLVSSMYFTHPSIMLSSPTQHPLGNFILFISRSRQDAVCLPGYFPLNLCGLSPTSSPRGTKPDTAPLCAVLSTILPRVAELPLTLSRLNKTRFAPGLFVGGTEGDEKNEEAISCAKTGLLPIGEVCISMSLFVLAWMFIVGLILTLWIML